MAQLWALTRPDGSFRQLWTESADHHPADHGHADDCIGVNVWPLARAPVHGDGEGIDHLTGALTFDAAPIRAGLLAEIKAAAAACIAGFYPLWRQINDLHDPESPAIAARRTRLAAVRAASDTLEQQLAGVADAAAVHAIREQIELLRRGAPHAQGS